MKVRLCKEKVFLTKDVDLGINYFKFVDCYSIDGKLYTVNINRLEFDNIKKEIVKEDIYTLATLIKVENDIHFVKLTRKGLYDEDK